MRPEHKTESKTHIRAEQKEIKNRNPYGTESAREERQKETKKNGGSLQ